MSGQLTERQAAGLEIEAMFPAGNLHDTGWQPTRRQCARESEGQTWPMSTALVPLAALPAAPARARALIRGELPLWRMGDLVEPASLVISELVTNALQALAGLRSDSCMPLIWIGLFADGVRLVVEVWDKADGIPEIRDCCEFEESGRGLVLVDAICDSWGWKAGPGGRCKCVWAELSKLPILHNSALLAHERHVLCVTTLVPAGRFAAR